MSESSTNLLCWKVGWKDGERQGRKSGENTEEEAKKRRDWPDGLDTIYVRMPHPDFQLESVDQSDLPWNERWNFYPGYHLFSRESLLPNPNMSNEEDKRRREARNRKKEVGRKKTDFRTKFSVWAQSGTVATKKLSISFLVQTPHS